ncbi:hypothetical protein Pfo_018763 [Paulownia fortunei]|nr:hypothetical protein Pfo_018763 [Paulownia fortunei]
MALYHHRMFLLAEPDQKYASPCYMCYVCPDDCYLSPPPPSSQPAEAQKNQMSTILILMLCVLGFAFLFLSYLTIGRYRSSLRNSRRRDSASLENGNFRENFIDEHQGPVVDHPIWYIRTVGLPQSVIDSIAVFKYKKGERLIEGCDCSVCLNEFQEDENLRLLPKCSHAFHVPCIDTWLRSHKNCPVCRAPILISNANNVHLSSVETSSSNSGSMEVNQVQNELETRREVETNETRGIRDVAENSSAMPIQEDKLTDMLLKSRCIFNAGNEKLRVLSDLADHRVKVDEELQPVRRSVSMDFSAASMIYHAVANSYTKKDEGCSDTKLEIVEKQNSDMIVKRGCRNSSIYRLIKSSSYGCSLQKGPVSMKRSFSFSGKRSLRKNSRSQESIPIPELSIQNRSR